MSSYKDKVKARKEQLIAAAEFSDSAIEALATNELAEDSINLLTDLCDKMHKASKSSGSAQDWETPQKWEYGPVNGMIGKFLTQWVYLPDTLKHHMGLNIPATAFTSATLDDWGKLTRCTPLGQILPSVTPNITSVAMQVELVKAYLDLPFVPAVMTEQEWQEREAIAAIKAESKALDIEEALLKDEEAKDNGEASFTID